jgi:predicted aconitase
VQADELFYPVFGHLLGKIARDRVPVVTGLEVRPTEDQLKLLCAAAASSGQVALFHVVGLTPEAPTLEAAFQGRAPGPTVAVRVADLRAAHRELDTAGGGRLDLVTVGCPHFSLAEFQQLAALVAGQRAQPAVRFLVTSSREMVRRARAAGYLEALEDFGGTVTVDTCPLATPMLPPEIKTAMTNSAKHAYYAPGLLTTQVALGSLADCVRSAVAGHIVRTGPSWAT